jgi:hypothetical protein
MGMPRKTLNRRCKQMFKATSKQLVWREVRARVARGRGLGMTLDAIAEQVGYSDGNALARALASRGRGVSPGTEQGGSLRCPKL